MSHTGQSWYEASARERVVALVDTGSFEEFIGPQWREISPHLAVFDLPAQFDDGIVVGAAAIDGMPVLVAAQEGRFMGGAFGEVHGAKLTGLLRAAKAMQRDVVVAFDTGGVRLQEANAGELAIAEIMRAIVEARMASVRVVGLIGGRAGCYGGGGLIAGCCSTLIVSEQGRISVSGPEVIETNRGVEEFDSRDRAFVWRTMGGKHRMLIGGADAFVDDAAEAFRTAAIAALARPASFTAETLAAEQARLERRIARFGDASDATDIWLALGIDEPTTVPAMPAARFVAVAATHRRAPMKPADILDSLFPVGHDVTTADHLSFGTGSISATTSCHVIGAGGGAAIGIDEAILLAARVLAIASNGDDRPIVLLVDTSSQRMSRRDELLGLSEYLAHLAKALLLAEANGHRTIGLLYGGSAAGAFIATALACGTLVALPGAHPEVMDLPSMARVTKLPIEVLKEKAKATPVFAPGLDNLAQTGAIADTWDPAVSLSEQFAALLSRPRQGDGRATLGEVRGGRPKAAAIADRVAKLAQTRGDPMQLDRHLVVHLDPTAWPALIGARSDLEAIPDIADWAMLGRPLVARGRLCGDPTGTLPLGLPLPPSMGRQRLTFAVEPDAVIATRLPPRLVDAIHVAPVAWHATLVALVAIDGETRCFGSLAWQHLTGLPYLSATSDIDLLWQVPTREDADRLVASIAIIDAQAPLRIDGEVVAPGGLSIQWREWAGGAAELLAKRPDGHRLVKRAEVFS